MGDYAKITDFETFAIKNTSDPHSDIAALKAVRLVIAAEAKDDTKSKFNIKKLDTELIKKLSGGEPLKCRFLYGEWFELFAEFKLWLMLNELPTITDNSHAMWRRLVLIPFNVIIPQEQKILDFDKILYNEERAGILLWILDGYKKYRKLGKLKTCSAMEIAKNEYHMEQDDILRFVNDELYGHIETIKTKECYDLYKSWCTGEEIVGKGKKDFFKVMKHIDGLQQCIVRGENVYKVLLTGQQKITF
jgi:putative DNA primase/helicase